MFRESSSHGFAACSLFLLTVLFCVVSGAENEFSRCNCEEESGNGVWSVESILECQRVSDFLIAVAYFSIPIELIYFISCSNVPFKWVLSQFIAFIVLCGLTHLLNAWTYGPHTFQLVLALTVFKFLTALVSCATAITLVTLIPLLLKVKVREFMLKKKTWDLGREVGLIRRQKEAGLHVRMLTQEIRKSLDRHTILYTTMVELSSILDLQNCAVWMPNEDKSEVILTHELKGRSPSFSSFRNRSISIMNPDVIKVKSSHGVKILNPDTAFVGEREEYGHHAAGAVAAIRMPMLRFSNFKGGTPERIQTYYAILVLVLPAGTTAQELEIVNVVADQVAVALSHAAVLEESQFMREKLEQQNRALQQARKNAVMASRARNSFQEVMGGGMRKPMHSILGLLSLIQKSSLGTGRGAVADAMLKSGFVLSALIDDLMEMSPNGEGMFAVGSAPFSLRSMVREVSSIARCLCVLEGFGFSMEADRSLPDSVTGDERRTIQVVLHILGSILTETRTAAVAAGGIVVLRVAERRNGLSVDRRVNIEFEVSAHHTVPSDYKGTLVKEDLRHSVCKRLVQLMHGSVSVDGDRVSTVLGFQLPSSLGGGDGGLDFRDSSSQRPLSNSLFRGLQVLVVDSHDVNRNVTRKLLERLDCCVSSVSSGMECLGTLGATGSSFQIVVVDLHLPDLNGYEVARQIRQSQSINNLPLLIALTSSADNGVWEACVRSGYNGIICKPVVLDIITGELRRLLLQASRSIL